MSFALRFRRPHVLASTLFTLLSFSSITPQPVQAVPALTGYEPTDFLVAGFDDDVIAVYDQNFTFKGYLDTNFNEVEALDILPNGNVVAANPDPGFQVRQYNAAGAVVNTFTNSALGYVTDIKSGPNNRLYAATAKTSTSVQELSQGGTALRNFGSKAYYGVAVLPNGTLWATGDDISGIDVYSLSSGSFINNIPYDNGQGTAYSLTYDARSNTVLMADADTQAIYERTLSGEFVREYNVPDSESLDNTYGVTRGPNGKVYATDYIADKVYAWNSTGTYLGAVDISATADGPCNIIWMGNASTYNSSVNATGTLRTKDSSIQTSLWAANNKNGLSGSLFYNDKSNKTVVQSNKITSIVIQGNQAYVYGICTLNGEAGYSFEAIVTDSSPTFLGRGDDIELEVKSLGDSFYNSGTFNPGDAKVTGSSNIVLVP